MPYQYAYAAPTVYSDPSGFTSCYTCTLHILPGVIEETTKFILSLYDKQGISRNCTVTLDNGQHDLTDTVDDLFTDFICEDGSQSRFYPFNTRLTQELYQTRAIIDYREIFYERGYLEEEGTMGPSGFLNARYDAGDACDWTVFAGVDVCLSITNFLGGFRVKATKVTSGGKD